MKRMLTATVAAPSAATMFSMTAFEGPETEAMIDKQTDTPTFDASQGEGGLVCQRMASKPRACAMGAFT